MRREKEILERELGNEGEGEEWKWIAEGREVKQGGENGR